MGLTDSLKTFLMKFPGWGGSTGGVWRTYDSFTSWDSAYYQTLGLSGDASEPDYASEVGDPLSSSLVMAAVRWVGNTLPEARIQVREPQAEGEPVEVEGHPLVELLRRPNPFYSGSTLWKAFAASWVTAGNAYFLKGRGRETGRTMELWYVPHWMIEPRWPEDGTEFVSHYELDVDGRKLRVETADVIHFRDGLDFATRKGVSPLMSLWRELYGDVQASRYSARVSKNFGVPPFALSPKPDQSGVDVDVEKIKAALMRQITGANTGKPLVLSSAFDVHQFSAKPSEMNTETQHRIPEERVAAVIGIPAMVLGFGAGLERSTFSNMEQAHEYAYESYLIPLQRYVAEELNHQLLPEMDSRPGRFVFHDVTQVRALQEDMVALYTREALAYEKGIKMRSEVRGALGLKSGPEDDVYYVQPSATVVDAEAGPDEDGIPPGDEESDTEDADTKALKSVPPEEEVDAAVEWWDAAVPAEAVGILDAKLTTNGNGRR